MGSTSSEDRSNAFFYITNPKRVREFRPRWQARFGALAGGRRARRRTPPDRLHTGSTGRRDRVRGRRRETCRPTDTAEEATRQHRQRSWAVDGRGIEATDGNVQGSGAWLGPNPGGEQSPWKERVRTDRQRSWRATDPTAEQRPEVEGRRGSDCFGSRAHEGVTARGKRQWTVGNDRTQYGCGRGDFFVGCEQALRGPSQVVGRGRVFFGRPGCGRGLGVETRRTSSGSGLQYTRDPATGANRRGGEKPRGRNATGRLEPAGQSEAATLRGSGQL